MRLAFAIVGLVALACSPTVSPSHTPSGLPQVLSLENRGGPTLVVNINGSEAATIECGGGTTLTPGGGRPQLPWSLSIARRADAAAVYAGVITDLPQWYLQIGETSMGLGSTPPLGPAVTCPPGDSPTPAASPTLIPGCIRDTAPAIDGVVELRPEGWFDQGPVSGLPVFPNTRGRVYGPEGTAVPPDEGPGHLALYESFPANDAYFESRIAQSRKNGGEAVAVSVCGEATEVWLDKSSGELVIGWTDRNKSDVLVANTADFTVQELVDSAERVYDCCG
jgi:hypothetical protein